MASMASLDIFSEGERFDPKKLQEKMRINRYAFSGGQDSIEKHRELGAHRELTGVDTLNTIGYIYARKSAKELQARRIGKAFLVALCEAQALKR
ncbi:unnamed protein product [Prunus armeniaca]